jgi:uncharacterized protein HemX
MPDQPVTRGELRRTLLYMEGVLLLLTLILSGLGYFSVHLQEQHGAEVEAIRQQRGTSITESCEAQNRRNAELSRFLNSLPTAKHQSATQKRLMVQFVDALAPHEDCHAVLLKRTGH